MLCQECLPANVRGALFPPSSQNVISTLCQFPLIHIVPRSFARCCPRWTVLLRSLLRQRFRGCLKSPQVIRSYILICLCGVSEF